VEHSQGQAFSKAVSVYTLFFGPLLQLWHLPIFPSPHGWYSPEAQEELLGQAAHDPMDPGWQSMVYCFPAHALHDCSAQQAFWQDASSASVPLQSKVSPAVASRGAQTMPSAVASVTEAQVEAKDVLFPMYA